MSAASRRDEPVDLVRDRRRVVAGGLVAELEGCGRVEDDRMRRVPRRAAHAVGGRVVEEHLIPRVVELPRDRARDLEGARRIRICAVQDPRRGRLRRDLDQRRDVRGCGRVVDARAPMGEEDRGAPVEHALHEDPLARRARARPVDLRRPEHGHGYTAVEQDLLGRDLVRAVALAAHVVAASGRHRRLRLGNGAVEARLRLRVGVVAVAIDVHRLARDHHGRLSLARERQQASRILRGEADAVDEQVGPAAESRSQLSIVTALGGHEPSSGRCDVVRKARRIPPRELDLPPGGQKTTRRRAPDRTRSSEDQRATHDR